MKISIIHGENNFASRTHLNKSLAAAKTKGWTVSRLGNSQMKISEELANLSLFSEKTLYFLDNLEELSAGELEWIGKNSDQYSGFFLAYSSRVVPQNTLKQFPKDSKVEKFDVPQRVFSLMEAFYPGNAKVFLSLLHQVVKTEPIEFVFSLLAKHLRDLYWISKDSATLGYPDWRKSKLEKQAGKFKIGLLVEIIQKLSEIDVAVKTSKANLLDSLGLLVVKLL